MANRKDPHGDQFFALKTFRRNGTPVSTPIWLAPEGDRWYAYTPSRSWKVKRLRHDPRVEIAQSDFGGTPREEWRPGRARVLPKSELAVAKRAMTAKYGFQFRIFKLVTFLGRPRKHGGPAVGLEITLD